MSVSPQKPERLIPSKLSLPWVALLYAVMCAPMALLLLECARGAYCDFEMIRTAALRSEMNRLRSQAVRRAGNLEVLLEPHAGKASEGAGLDWSGAQRDKRLQTYWQALESRPHPQLYSAVLNRSRVVQMHSDAKLIDTRLASDWYDRKLPEAGDDVFRVDHGELAAGRPAFDLSVPLFVERQQIGEYHEGLDADWFHQSIWPQQRDVLMRWSGVLALVLVADGLALGALLYIKRHNAQLLQLVQRGIQEQSRVLAKVGGGLAHQIRNPLHALRINLHLLRRSQHGQTRLSPEQLDATFRESDVEIDTLDRLMRDLLQFTVPNSGAKTETEVGPAVMAALNLFDEEFRRQQLEIKVDLCPQPIVVNIDPNHLRQAVGNLLAFAQSNTPIKGQIELTLARRGRQAELTVGHSGPALTKQQQEQIFEPFQSSRESVTGLELALVQCVALEAGGTVTCEKRIPSGNRFRVSIPLSENVSQEITP